MHIPCKDLPSTTPVFVFFAASGDGPEAMQAQKRRLEEQGHERRQRVLRQLGGEVDRLDSTIRNHAARGSMPLREAVRFPALVEALAAQRRVRRAGNSLKCGVCNAFLSGLCLGPHGCAPLELEVAAMQRDGMLATRGQIRAEKLRRLAAGEGEGEEAAARRGDDVRACRLCNMPVGAGAAVHRCSAYFCTNLLVECTDLPDWGMDLGAAGQEKAARLLQWDLPILTVMRPATCTGVGGDGGGGELCGSLTFTAAAGRMGRGLFAAARLPKGSWVAPYSGRRVTPEQAMADSDPTLACSLVSRHKKPTHPSAVYMQPAGLGAVGRMPNHCCGGTTMRLVRGIRDGQRGHEVARLRTTREVQPGEQLTWRYDATTDCRAEAAAVLCQCPVCDASEAAGGRRNPFYAAARDGVDRCGTCGTCLDLALT